MIIPLLIGGSDYVSISNLPVVFMAGDGLGSTACTNVTVIDDDVVESNETFSITATASSDPVNILMISEAEVIITDDDGKKSVS